MTIPDTIVGDVVVFDQSSEKGRRHEAFKFGLEEARNRVFRAARDVICARTFGPPAVLEKAIQRLADEMELHKKMTDGLEELVESPVDGMRKGGAL